ncbi:hypothetical protein H4F45_13485 [Pectobacterium brasiliense]|uniref:Uncharacterized protein n=1 Tax=Pectobacterium brasiliense TaxID=180957 RepID=A0AAE3BF20_9GAMM|nr:hypothetical protein [Pectobacterium brasiliense]MBN3052462.1 hypothetical protein [Pectobacterium brasiliense]
MPRKSLPRRERVSDGPPDDCISEGTVKRRNSRVKDWGHGAASIGRPVSGATQLRKCSLECIAHETSPACLQSS